MDADSPKLLTLPQVADRLGVSSRTIKNRVKRGEFAPVIDIGIGKGSGRLRVTEAALVAWIEQRARGGE